MTDDAGQPAGGRLARGLRWLGRVTSPETDSGQRFTQAEKRLTALLSRLAEDPRFLRVTGELLRKGALARIRRQAAIEAIVRALRLPPASEVESLREQLRRMNDQVEALSSQLELVVDLLEKQAAAGSASSSVRAPGSAPSAAQAPADDAPTKGGV